MRLFHISCFITDNNLHEVMLLLEKYQARDLQVKTVRSELGKPNGSGKRPRGQFDKPGYEVIAELVSEGPLRWGELREAFAATGRSPKSIGSALDTAKNKKLVKKNSSGQFVRGSRA